MAHGLLADHKNKVQGVTLGPYSIPLIRNSIYYLQASTHIRQCFCRKIDLIGYLEEYQSKANRRSVIRRIRDDIRFAEENSKMWAKVKKSGGMEVANSLV